MSAIQMLLGGGFPNIILTGALTAVDTATNPTSATCAITLQASGDIQRLQNGVTSDIGDWLAPKTGMSDYECRMTPISGTLTSGTINTYQALSADRGYSITQSGVGVKTFSGTLEVRRIGTTAPIGSATVSLTATVEL